MERPGQWLRRVWAALPGLLRPPGRVAAQQRHTLERTLHDGAVSEMSALALELGMISDAASGSGVEGRLAAVQNRVTEILEDLRGVGSAIYPPVLATAGLGPGLLAVAERRGLRLMLDLPHGELGQEARSRAGLLVVDHFHTLLPGSVVRVRVRGRRVVRVCITDHQPGVSARRAHRAVLRCG